MRKFVEFVKMAYIGINFALFGMYGISHWYFIMVVFLYFCLEQIQWYYERKWFRSQLLNTMVIRRIDSVIREERKYGTGFNITS
jgi:hypothetical protein